MKVFAMLRHLVGILFLMLHLVAVLGHLGAILGHLKKNKIKILGPVWGYIGAISRGHLEAICGPFWGHYVALALA